MVKNGQDCRGIQQELEKSRKVQHLGYNREGVWISDLNYQKFYDTILFPRILVSFRIDSKDFPNTHDRVWPDIQTPSSASKILR